MKSFLRVGLSLLTLFSFSAAQASEDFSELHLIKGKVLVNSGHGFVSAAAVHAGDKILIGENSRALLSFPGGCDVPLMGKQIYVVPFEPPCAPAEKIAEAPPTLPDPPPMIAPTPAVVESAGAGSMGTIGVIGAVGAVGLLAGGALLLLRKPASG